MALITPTGLLADWDITGYSTGLNGLALWRARARRRLGTLSALARRLLNSLHTTDDNHYDTLTACGMGVHLDSLTARFFADVKPWRHTETWTTLTNQYPALPLYILCWDGS